MFIELDFIEIDIETTTAVLTLVDTVIVGL